MFLRKLYLKIRLFLYASRRTINKIILFSMLAASLYVLINSFVFGFFVIGKANDYQINKDYRNAITFYNAAYKYYGFNHLSEENKEIYMELPYQMAVCYLKNNDKKESVRIMLLGITSIQKQYGIFSPETAYFMRKYLIEYYLNNNNISLARQEFNNLLTIYKHIGYNNSEMASLVYLGGDLYYQQKKYEQAIIYYEKAYKIISGLSNIDYEVFSKIVNRICDYEIQNKKTDKAISIYTSSIQTLKTAIKPEPELTAAMLISLGNIYRNEDYNIKNAIKCYEEAIEIIKKLPKTTYLKQNINKYYEIMKDLYNKDGQYHKLNEIEVEMARKRRFSFFY